MIYLIFTAEGFAEAFEELVAEKASLWINDKVLSDQQTAQLNAHGISINVLPHQVNGANEKAVIAALEHVEKQAPKTEILVEYL